MKQGEQQDASKSRLYSFILNYVMLPTYILQICVLTTYIAAWFGINESINQSQYKYHLEIGQAEQARHATREANALLASSFDLIMRVEAIIEEYQTYGLPADLTPVALPPARLVQCVYSSSYCYYLPDDDATPFAALADSLRNAIAVQAEVLSSLLPEDNNAIAVSIHVKNATNEYTVLKLVDADILSPPPIFASFKQCFINGLCSQNYETSNGKFDFRVFEKSQGIRLSPLQFYNKPVDNSNIFAYSRTNSLKGALRTITLYFDGTFQNATSAQSTTFGNKNALLVSDPVAGMQPLSVLWNERKAPSLWQLNALDETYRQTMKSLFTAGLEKGSVFVPIENGKEAEAELTSPGGLRVRAVVGWTNNNLASEAMTYGAQYKSEDMGGQISLFAIYIISAFFIYKYSLVTSFVVQILTSVLKDIKDLGSVVRDENIFATNFDHIHFKEIRDLVIQMANYKMLVQFIATIKSKDALNPMKLKHFLLPFQNTDNHAANVYLFNFFMKEFSEQDDKLDEAIKYGFLLYSTYEKMLSGLAEEGRYNEFEVSRINMSIFRLFEILLKLMGKSARQEKEYSYEEALILYERAVKLVEALKMNDTVRLSFLLLKIKLLLKLAKYGTARELLTEANTLLQLVLKNKRILVFIEEESNLLTYYSQQILDLEAEYYFNNGESKKALETQFTKRTGDVYNTKKRIKVLERMNDIIRNETAGNGGRRRKLIPKGIADKATLLIDKYIKLTRNTEREFVLLLDSSYESLDHLPVLKWAFASVLDGAMVRGDTVSTFCFGQELQMMDVGLREEDLNDVHAYVCKYFDFVRRNMLGSKRNYYDCILEALTASKQKMEPGGNRPMYVILGIFGEHNPRVAGSNGIGLTNLKSLISSAVNIMESKTKNDSSLNGIQDIVDEENVNLLIFTSCLDKLKKEKLYQIMTIAKRSLVVDLDSPACKAHQLLKLLKDFVC